MRHLQAWIVDPETRMNPDLDHAQAIIGVNTGRAIGVIDTLQIVEVARAAALFARQNAPGYAAIRAGVEGWFADYLDWLTPSPLDRKSVVSGKSVSVRVALGGRRIMTKKLN